MTDRKYHLHTVHARPAQLPWCPTVGPPYPWAVDHYDGRGMWCCTEFHDDREAAMAAVRRYRRRNRRRTP